MHDRAPVLQVCAPNTTSSVPKNPSLPASSKKSNVGRIVGGVIGGLVGLGLLVFLVIFYWRRSHEEPDDNVEKVFNNPSNLSPRTLMYENSSKRLARGGGPALDEKSLLEPGILAPLGYCSAVKEKQAAASEIATSYSTLLAPSSSAYTSSSSAYPSSSAANSSIESPPTAPLSNNLNGVATNRISTSEGHELWIDTNYP